MQSEGDTQQTADPDILDPHYSTDLTSTAFVAAANILSPPGKSFRTLNSCHSLGQPRGFRRCACYRRTSVRTKEDLLDAGASERSLHEEFIPPSLPKRGSRRRRLWKKEDQDQGL